MSVSNAQVTSVYSTNLQNVKYQLTHHVTFGPLFVRIVLYVRFCAGVSFKRKQEYLAGYTGPTIDITYSMHLHRRPLYYVIYMILPTTVISFMSLFAFLLPSDSGEKIGLGLFISHYVILDQTPPC